MYFFGLEPKPMTRTVLGRPVTSADVQRHAAEAGVGDRRFVVEQVDGRLIIRTPHRTLADLLHQRLMRQYQVDVVEQVGFERRRTYIS